MGGRNQLAYVNLIRSKRNLHEAHKRQRLDQIEEALLDQVILNWAEGKKVGLRTLCKFEKLGSLVTLNIRIKNLINQGHIKLVPDQIDRRIKYAVPSEKTIEYVEALSAYINDLSSKS
jgi:hypothetical protein